MTDPTVLSATELAAALASRTFSASEVLSAYLQRIERLNPPLNAIIHLDAERAMAAAARADSRRPVGRLHGVPMTLKDSHRVAGMPTVVGNPDAPRACATRDGFVAARLRSAGAILIGKTNVAQDLADFQTDNPVFGRTNNPWNHAFTPGGSSGGAAAALAARLTPLEVGSDIAGSIRLPAAFTGVIGLKPGADLISRRGHITEPVAHPRGGGVGTLATIGPMARTYDDIATLLDVFTGPRPGVEFDAGRTSIGVLNGFDGMPVETSIQDALDSIVASARRRSVRIEPVEPPSNLAEQHRTWIDLYAAARAEGIGWRSHAAVVHRQRQAQLAWNEPLRRHHALLLPAAMCVAFPHCPTGAAIAVNGEPAPYWRLARYAEPFNLTGLPAIAFPIGNDAANLPVGLQLVSRASSERWLVRAAEWLSGGEDIASVPSSEG